MSTSARLSDRPALVRVFRGEQRVMEVPLDRTRFVVGRNTDAEICLDDPTVSRPHAELVCGPFGRWWVHDLGSTNGTKIDGRQITERMLHHRDRVKVGDFILEFRHTPRDRSIMPRPDDSVPGLGDETIQLSALAPLSERAQVLPKHLSSMTELGRKLLTTKSVEERLAELLSYFVGEGMPGDSAVALRLDGTGNTSVIGGPFHRFGPSENGPYRSRAVLHAIWQSRETVVATNLDELSGGNIELSLPAAVRPVAIVASPLAISDDHMDIAYVEFPWHYGTGQWSAMVELVAASYRQARMVWQMRQDLLASARIEHDLAMANEVQSRLLPDCDAVRLLDVAVGYEPSHWVGGDYVDVVELADGRLLLVIADVCGKGLSAALVSSSVHTMVHAHAARELNLEQLVEHLDHYLNTHLPDASFVTLLGVVIHPQTGRLECLNAGHPGAAVVGADGQVRWLQQERNVAVGMVPDTQFEVERTHFYAGDTLLMFTDGAFEGFDEALDWTAEKVVHTLAQQVRQRPQATSAELTKQLSATLEGMRGAHFRADDTTLLIARYPQR